MATTASIEPTPHAYYRHLNQHQFTVELELLSSLASPSYLTNLHALGHLHDPAFLRYLAHLLSTWSTPRFVRFVRFPQALVFGRALVRSPVFRQMVGSDGWEHEVTHELVAAWAGLPVSDGTNAANSGAPPSLPHLSVDQTSTEEIAAAMPDPHGRSLSMAPTVKQEDGTSG